METQGYFIFVYMKKIKQTYFSHDSNARNDIKLLRLRAKYGYEGYGIYFALVEMLFSENNKLSINEFETLAFGLQCDSKKLEDIVLNFDLFDLGDQYFYSKRLNEVMNEIHAKSLKASENAKKRWNNNAPAMQTQSDRNAIKLNEIKLDEIKSNKIKSNKIKVKDIELRVTEFKNSVINNNMDINNKHKLDFIDYWTEPNKSGTKLRFELEKTWSIDHRLKRWSNSSFNKEENGIKFPDYYDIHFAKRLEQDQNATLLYHKHLESIGYVKELNAWNGSSKWIKK